MSDDTLYDELLAAGAGQADRELAARYAPVLAFDEREPFLPLAAGYTVFRADGPSPSFPRQIYLAAPGQPPAALAIEYAIWWDWDIGHLYELEHVWVYLDESGALLRCEASAHGGFAPMLAGGDVERDGERPVVYAEPGKHAFAAAPEGHRPDDAPYGRTSTNGLAGIGGLLVTPLYRGTIRRTPLDDTLARSYLAPLAFEPSYRFTRRVVLGAAQLVPWPALDVWVPRRVEWWLARLAREIPTEQYHPLRVGHRGAAGHAPDNSLAGVEAAARLGAHLAEIDARLSADGILMAAHDAAVHDAAGRELPISQHTLAELRAAAPLVTVDEVLQRCRALRVGLYLELKDERAALPALAAISANGYDGSAIIASFRPEWLAAVRAAAPEMPTAVLFGQTDADPLALAAGCGASYVHPCWKRHGARPDELLTPAWVTRVRQAGLGIVTWDEERPEVIAGVRRAGVDAICSDRPELLR